MYSIYIDLKLLIPYYCSKWKIYNLIAMNISSSISSYTFAYIHIQYNLENVLQKASKNKKRVYINEIELKFYLLLELNDSILNS